MNEIFFIEIPLSQPSFIHSFIESVNGHLKVLHHTLNHTASFQFLHTASLCLFSLPPNQFEQRPWFSLCSLLSNDYGISTSQKHIYNFRRIYKNIGEYKPQ